MSTALVAITLSALLACHDTTAPTAEELAVSRVAKVGVGFDSGEVGFLLGATARLRAGAYDSAGRPIDASLHFEWASSNPLVIEVDQSGRITARGVGSAYVYAGVASGVNGYRHLFVATPAQALSVYPDWSRMLVGQRRKMLLQYRGSPDTLTGTKWSTSNSAVATVGDDGVVTAVGPGVATVSVTYSNTAFQAELSVDDIATPLRFTSLVAGGATCGLATSGTAYCWGSAAGGVLGNTERMEGCVTWWSYPFPFGGEPGGPGYAWVRQVESCAKEPIRVATSQRFLSVDMQGGTVCGLTSIGEAYCWGATGDLTGEAGGPTVVPVSAQLRFTSFSFPCGVTASNEAWCFGDLTLRGAPATAVTVPTQVSGGATWAYVAGGSGVKHRCGITTSGVVQCWGNNTGGKLGTGDTVSSSLPVPVQSTERFSAVAVSVAESCALSLGQQLYCWGDGRTTPTAVSPTLRFTSFSFTSSGLCAVGTDASAYCRASPTTMATEDSGSRYRLMLAGSLYRGSLYRCGIRDDGLAYCRGTNGAGQLGNGANPEYELKWTPVAGQ